MKRKNGRIRRIKKRNKSKKINVDNSKNQI